LEADWVYLALGNQSSDIRHKAWRTAPVPVEAVVTRYSLEKLRQRYVIEGRPLEAGLVLDAFAAVMQELTGRFRQL